MKKVIQAISVLALVTILAGQGYGFMPMVDTFAGIVLGLVLFAIVALNILTDI